MHHCIQCVEFFETLDNLLMEIMPALLIPRLAPANRNRTFDLLHPVGWCYQKTRFRVVQLRELYHLLEFPAVYTLTNRSHYASSEEAFIIMLMKLATGDSNVVLADTFGFSGDGMISLIYRFMIGILDNKARGILHDGVGCLQRWAHLFPEFAEIIRRKLNMPQYGGLAFERCRLIGFLDCKFDETCAPGTGPMTDEELADRWEEADLIQEAVYSGYVKVHGIKVLTILFPNGITGYLYGPISGRKNDIAVLNMSWVNTQLLLLQDEITAALARGEDAVYFALFSDSIFPYHLCITHRHEPPLGGVLHQRLEAENNQQHGYLLQDSFSVHLHHKSIRALNDIAVETDFIPGGCTPVLQVMDKGVFKPFKDYIRQESTTWKIQHAHGTKPTREDIAHWIQHSWDRVDVDTITNTWQSINYQPYQP